MTVRARLLGSFAVITAVLLVPSIYAVVRLSELRDLAVEGRGRHASAVLALGRMGTSLAELDRLERSFLATGDDRLRRTVRERLGDLRARQAELEAYPYARAAELLRPVLIDLETSSRSIDGLVARGRIEAATLAFREMETLFPRADERLDRIARVIGLHAQEEFERARRISAAARNTTVAGLIGVPLLALAIGLWTTGVLTRPLRRLAQGTADVADGSFEAPEDLPYGRLDEIGELSRSFRAMTERLAALDRMKAEFVGVASHELKTPINVIRGYSELIEEELAGDLTESQAEILAGIAEQARAMGRLVSRLMDISRLEAGSYRLEKERVHVEDLVTGLARAFDMLARRKNISLETRVAPDVPPTLVIDVDIVRDEVLGNLVSNAIEHTPAGGTVRIDVRPEGDGVLFEVADSGPGIPAEHRPHIFEKYYQVERSAAVGSGLGLAIAREMVELHQGRIELADGHAPGAVFRVVLPGPDAAASDAA